MLCLAYALFCYLNIGEGIAVETADGGNAETRIASFNNLQW